MFSKRLTETEKIAQQAMLALEDRLIPATPENYTVWYHYYSGDYPDLKRTLDILIDNGQEVAEKRCRELYRKFFTFEDEAVAVSHAGQRVGEELEQVMKYLSDVDKGMQKYSDDLNSASTGLNAVEDATEAKPIVDKVLESTTVMSKKNAEAAANLELSSTEISDLKAYVEELQRDAVVDGLTGISNRKHFDISLRHLATEAMEEGKPLSMIMLDIDYFKNFNDTYGHQVGDQVLKLVAKTLRTIAKGDDLSARYGGEEFAVILPGRELKDGHAIAEKIREKIASSGLVDRKSGKSLGKITLSAGVGQFAYGEPLTGFIARCDEAQYLAKESGRNCVKTEEALPKSTN
ncbi:MAG: GGDEF domain-containing protein [Alphaproteobacteria bacterium]|nr:GGDEF domain-containing protein [Rhodospirillales bacterium]MCW9045599.1 GGDEF domain-containing protein [Alphaproteobacteria bacterium]